MDLISRLQHTFIVTLKQKVAVILTMIFLVMVYVFITVAEPIPSKNSKRKK